jgi:hypothetical protein
MFQSHLATRQRMGLSSILRTFKLEPETERAISTYCPQYWLGTDKAGRPIYCQSFQELNSQKLFEVVDPDKLLECQAYTCENLLQNILPACSKQAGRPVRQTASLIDFKDVSYKQLWSGS